MRRVEIGLWATGAVLLTAAVGVRADAGLYQWRAGRQLEQVIATPVPGAIARPALAEGTPLAKLRIPRLGLEAVVAEGVEESVLSRAVGHLPSSARPGEIGNIALAAHRDTFFRPLEGIRVGDLVRLEAPSGTDEYRVEWFSVVAPHDVAVLAATDHPALTLVTCYPFRYIGPAPERFVVRARRVGGDPSIAPPRPVEARQLAPRRGAAP
ncbi:MAG: hypothetical protein AMXMBFR36_18430 [Acidobacteriota bacterium]